MSDFVRCSFLALIEMIICCCFFPHSVTVLYDFDFLRLKESFNPHLQLIWSWGIIFVDGAHTAGSEVVVFCGFIFFWIALFFCSFIPKEYCSGVAGFTASVLFVCCFKVILASSQDVRVSLYVNHELSLTLRYQCWLVRCSECSILLHYYQ